MVNFFSFYILWSDTMRRFCKNKKNPYFINLGEINQCLNLHVNGLDVMFEVVILEGTFRCLMFSYEMRLFMKRNTKDHFF